MIKITYTTMHDGAERTSTIETDNKNVAISILTKRVTEDLKLSSSIDILNIEFEGADN